MTLLADHPRTVFTAPPGAYAPAPPERRGVRRDQVRLLVAGPDGIGHTTFSALPDHLEAGDVVVVNNSATVANAFDAHSRRLGPVVLHVASRLGDPDRPSGAEIQEWVLEIRTAPDAARSVLDATEGDRFTVSGLTATLVAPFPAAGSSPTGQGNRLWRVRVVGDLRAHLRRHGRPIAYGYLDRRYPLEDYQTVFGVRPGSAEMPSAGRPFTTALVTALVARGVAVLPVTLHTGLSSQEAGEAPQSEWFEVPAATAGLVTQAQSAGGRVVAVGTTVTRALESAARDGRLVAARGWTEHVVGPSNPPQVVTGLITGWHDPQASHLLLVEAVAGRTLTQRAYDAAVAEHYLWHEFGDAALLLPPR